MKQKPEVFDSFGGALQAGLSQMSISRKKWTGASVLISRELTQTKITAY
jgi:hypothetical protein